MALQQQIVEFRRLLGEAGQQVEDYELNAAGDGFRALLAGGTAQLEVRCRVSGVVRCYCADGSAGWLEAFSADLQAGVFAGN